jgi:hypothetical protein
MNAILDFNEANDELDQDAQQSRRSELTDYSELTLNSARNDKAHCSELEYNAIAQQKEEINEDAQT